MRQLRPRHQYHENRSHVPNLPWQALPETQHLGKRKVVNDVDKFTYLGSTLCRHVNIAKVSSAFGRLPNNLWERTGISLSTKLKVYQLLYA